MDTKLILAVATWIASHPFVRDGRGADIPRPRGFENVVAEVVADHPELPDPRVLASAFDVVAAHESAYDSAAVGDSGRSCGAWQTPCAETPMPAGWREEFDHAAAVADVVERERALRAAHQHRLTGVTREIRVGQARVAAKWLVASMARCPDHPLSLYATGTVCGPVRVADLYVREMRAEAAAPLVENPTPAQGSP